MRVVAFLQNPWSSKWAGKPWPRRSWLRALWRSRAGARLRRFTEACPSADIYWENAAPEVAASPNVSFPPDHDHIHEVLDRIGPRSVVAFGALAGLALRRHVSASLLILPHPTYRVVTNKLLSQGGRMLETGVVGVVELKQKVGKVEVICA